MHKTKTLVLVAILAAAIITVALVLAPRGGDERGEVLFPDLADAVNDVRGIVVQSADGPVTVIRHTNEWKVKEKDDYTADSSLVRRLVLDLAKARVLERKTKNPELYHELGVADIDADGSTAVEVVLTGVADKRLASLVIGKTVRDAERYVRLPDDPQSLLAAPIPSVPASPEDWLYREIIELPRDDIERIDVRHGDGGEVHLVFDETGEGTLDNIPPGKKVRYQFALNDYASTLARLEVRDVREAGNLDFGGVPSGRVTTRGRLVVDFSSAMDADATWLRFEASTLDDADEEAVRAAEVFNDRWRGWAYRLPDTAMARLTKPLSELVEDIDPKDDVGAPEEPGAADEAGPG